MQAHPIAIPAMLAFSLSLGPASAGQRALDVPYVPTPPAVVEAMLELAEVGPEDIVYDLGSGDGRILITAAARYGARGVGVDLDPERVEEARANAREADVDDRVEFIQGDLFELDFSAATVLTLYLLPTVNLELRPRILDELEPGTRVVSHAFDMGDWEPDQQFEVDRRMVYYWIVPAQVAGQWHWQDDEGTGYRLELEQAFQQVDGRLLIDGEPVPLEDARLHGETLSFNYRHPRQGLQQVEAQVENGTLIGATLSDELAGDDAPSWTAEREPLTAAELGDEG